MMAVMPNTRPILAMLEPMALPTASNGLFFTAAASATKISGADVPKDTTVSPMSIFDMPRLVARLAAPDRKRSALHTSATKPSSSEMMGTHIRTERSKCKID
jgi:hypothetical protein